MSQSRKQLREYDGSDGTWLTWKQHFKGHFSALKTGSSGKSYWDILEGSNPHEDGRMTTTTMLEAQVQLSCLVNGHSVGMVDQTGTAVYAYLAGHSVGMVDILLWRTSKICILPKARRFTKRAAMSGTL
jgi:hypothetical protein